MNIWIEGARPKTLIISLSPVLIGSVIALDRGFFDLLIFALTILCACSIQIGTNFTNDYCDFYKGADTEKRKGPRRLTQSGIISPQRVKKAAICSFACAILCAVYLMMVGGWIIGFLTVLSVLFGYLYTGGPCPLSYLGIADFFVLIFFGPIAVAGTTYLQANQLLIISIIAGFAPGLIATAILTSNNLRDVNEDRIANKKTLTVRFGLVFGRLEYAACLCIAGLIPVLLVTLTKAHYGCLLTSVSWIFIWPLIKHAHCAKHSHSLIVQTGKWMALYTALFLIGWCL